MTTQPPTSFRPRFCHDSVYGIPDFGALHPSIEQIKVIAATRQSDRPKEPPRKVALITKIAKRPGRFRGAIYRGARKMAGHDLNWALHWAFRIDDKYFELHRLPHTKSIMFTATSWTPERIKQIVNVDNEFATTFLADEEILEIGLHYVNCWRMDYSFLRNNCQKLLIAVSQDCLDVGSTDLNHARVGYHMRAAGIGYFEVLFRGVLKLLRCPRKQRNDYIDAMLEWQASVLDAQKSDEFGGYQYLKRDFNETSSPWATLFKHWRRRVVYNVHLNHAPIALFPYVKGLRTKHPEVTNMQASSLKWKNRTLLPFFPLHAVLGTGFFLYDLALLTAAHPRTLKDAFDRYAELKGTSDIAEYLESDLSGLTSKIILLHKRVLHDLGPKLKICKEAISKYWDGENTWEDMVTVWKQRMKDEGVSWNNIAEHLRTRRERFDGTSTVPDALTRREKIIDRILFASLVGFYITTLALFCTALPILT